MLRPIMRLALDRGLKYQDVDELIRDLMLDEAARDWAKRNGKEPSGSQLSVTTGINRKEVKKRVTMGDPNDTLPISGKSVASQVFLKWSREVQLHPSYSVLASDSADPSEMTFAKLVRSAGNDVHYRSVLDELLRLKLVSESAGFVRIESTSFVPPGASSETLAIVSDNAQAHLDAAIANIGGRDRPYLERAVWGDGISLAECEKIHSLARSSWDLMHTGLYDAIAQAPEARDGEQRHRIRVGTYVYFESIEAGVSQ
jgi:hypothetical protein